MSGTRDEVNDFLMGSGGQSFPFEEIGATVTGTIVEMKKRQQTNLETGEPQFWQNGDPKMMLVITLQTKLRENDDDEGIRNVYLRGGNYTPVRGKGSSSLVAVKDAVRKSGAEDGIQPGGTLTLTYSGEAEKANRAFNAPKLYTAEYSPPNQSVDLEEMA
jgi:hypothetical protein